jgi:hypothetical protein
MSFFPPATQSNLEQLWLYQGSDEQQFEPLQAVTADDQKHCNNWGPEKILTTTLTHRHTSF